MRERPSYILPLIVLAQFAGTSLWFAGNAILPDLQLQFELGKGALGNFTSAVQLGFISGTLLFAIFGVADRYAPSRVFFISSLLAALSNLMLISWAKDSLSIISLRFVTGFFLAGIYPVGMKIAADWYEKGLGKALGWLVGALVLGTALPHLLKGLAVHFSWQQIISFTSLFASAGGLLIFLFVKNGPYRKQGTAFRFKNMAHIFRSPGFRSAAFGYFGHMWELYTFWAFVPVLLAINTNGNGHPANIPLWSFLVIGVGMISCILGGYIGQQKGSARVAFYSLLLSGCCCLLSFIFVQASFEVFIAFLLLWGAMVVSDSPQFSAMVAQTADPAYKGTALTLVTCIGFSITIISIQLLNFLIGHSGASNTIFILLGAGPIVGLYFLYPSIKKK